MRRSAGKSEIGAFLARNTFPHPLTLGFFYREKMRAIHRIAPDIAFRRVLEVGGGRSSLTTLLYPEAEIVNLDLDGSHVEAPCNHLPRVRFVRGDAASLPFGDRSFDAVTLFDLLEHVPDDGSVASEVLRVLRHGGYVLVSTPNEHWRHPYYRCMKPICRSEQEIMEEWGHVRCGYSLDQLQQLFGGVAERTAGFITPLTVVAHDVAFSILPERTRRFLCLLLSPLTLVGYGLRCRPEGGTETAALWRKA